MTNLNGKQRTLTKSTAIDTVIPSLDIRVGFLHAANSRQETLNLDLAEIFKPLVVDRVIFTLINKK